MAHDTMQHLLSILFLLMDVALVKKFVNTCIED